MHRRLTRMKRWHAALALLGLVLAMRAWLEWVGPLPLDRWSAHRLGLLELRHGVAYDLATLMSALGSGFVAIVEHGLALHFVDRAAGRTAALRVAASAGVILVNAVLKVVLGPTPLFSATARDAPFGHNYPSGHTSFATAFYGSLALVACERGRRDVALVFA